MKMKKMHLYYCWW